MKIVTFFFTIILLFFKVTQETVLSSVRHSATLRHLQIQRERWVLSLRCSLRICEEYRVREDAYVIYTQNIFVLGKFLSWTFSEHSLHCPTFTAFGVVFFPEKSPFATFRRNSLSVSVEPCEFSQKRINVLTIVTSRKWKQSPEPLLSAISVNFISCF